MPLYYFKKPAELDDGTPVSGWAYLTPRQMKQIPGVSEELAYQKCLPDARDYQFYLSELDKMKESIAALQINE